MKASEVKHLWDLRANDTSLTKVTITFNDYWYRILEVERMLDWIKKNGPFQSVLDVGCGNGYTTDKIAKLVTKIEGLDYSEEMIKRATADYGEGEKKNITWKNGDITIMPTPHKYDFVVSSRCLINLVSWEDQQKALENIANALGAGGTFMMVECTKQGRARLNQFRNSMGLATIPPIPFNLDFDETVLWSTLNRWFRVQSISRFGLYEAISKVFHPLYVYPEEPKYLSKFNEIAYKMCKLMTNDEKSTINGLSHEFVAILKKK